jgi:UDP-N-acetylglucosamine 2-epimerase (non-hydrolysing)
MKVVTVFGTRPEIIRLSRVIAVIDRFCDHQLLHTGQNSDPALSDVFFDELGVRQPDIHLGVSANGFAAQAGAILVGCADAFERMRPDRVLILGDTNSGLAAVVAARMGIPVFHMEAGNRCYDDRVPEEINRRIIDHSSTVLMPYTHRSKENLMREGIARERIFVIGNPIGEVLAFYADAIAKSDVLERLSLTSKRFMLATLHRAENVDDARRVARLLDALSRVAEELRQPVIVSLHPRTRDRLAAFGLQPSADRVRFIAPLGLLDFVHLEQHASCVLTDSGTVQEECCIFKVPNVTMRDVTERAETIEVGSNILTGPDPEDVLRALRITMATRHDWTPPVEYLERSVSTAVAKIVLGYHHHDASCRRD